MKCSIADLSYLSSTCDHKYLKKNELIIK